MIVHLRGRENALELFGWTGRRAEWIALACLHGGVFTRAQWARFLGCHTEKVRRAVHALIAQGVATEENVSGITGIGRVCRVYGRDIYRALGAEDIRRRRITSTEVLVRRLVSLDYVLEYPRLPWLPTEHEKVGAFEALGIERRLLPVKAYRGSRRHHAAPLPGQAARRAGRRAHRRLWDALRERGRSVEVVAVFRTPGELERARTTLGKWANTAASSPATPEPGRAARCEIDRIEQAIRGMDDAVIEKHGGLQGCLKRIVELKDLLRSARPGTAIDGFTTWRSSRLPGGGS